MNKMEYVATRITITLSALFIAFLFLVNVQLAQMELKLVGTLALMSGILNLIGIGAVWANEKVKNIIGTLLSLTILVPAIVYFFQTAPTGPVQ